MRSLPRGRRQTLSCTLLAMRLLQSLRRQLIGQEQEEEEETEVEEGSRTSLSNLKVWSAVMLPQECGSCAGTESGTFLGGYAYTDVCPLKFLSALLQCGQCN